MATATQGAGDWMDMTLSDWLDVAPSEWMDRTMPGWRGGSYGTYGDLMQTTPREWLSMMYTPLASQTPWRTRQPTRHYHRHHAHRCGCDHHHEVGRRYHLHHRHAGCRGCGSERCECVCCVGDVDLVLYSRVGEQRVVPITIENERHRERDVKLEPSDWITRAGTSGVVETVSLDPAEFTIAPCAAQDVTLVVNVRGEQQDTGDKANEKPSPGQIRVPDVDACQVATAELRVVGCDRRSVRIAMAILPRDCDPFRVSCGCTCC